MHFFLDHPGTFSSTSYNDDPCDARELPAITGTLLSKKVDWIASGSRRQEKSKMAAGKLGPDREGLASCVGPSTSLCLVAMTTKDYWLAPFGAYRVTLTEQSSSRARSVWRAMTGETLSCWPAAAAATAIYKHGVVLFLSVFVDYLLPTPTDRGHGLLMSLITDSVR
ncbi:hypothetical protein ElyMa_006449200 [Elysia marginata]|uniref:Uncharacterized protein n=1 Tax=Elysia marginata TaxID=1093978 RepID=A0AAV4HY50_9GAST|nr:hypothetical protein ElyMa_006449200 [Elysia marginata]